MLDVEKLYYVDMHGVGDGAVRWASRNSMKLADHDTILPLCSRARELDVRQNDDLRIVARQAGFGCPLLMNGGSVIGSVCYDGTLTGPLRVIIHPDLKEVAG